MVEVFYSQCVLHAFAEIHELGYETAQNSQERALPIGESTGGHQHIHTPENLSNVYSPHTRSELMLPFAAQQTLKQDTSIMSRNNTQAITTTESPK